ncbi:MAG: flagellar export chaperone FliS [Zhaonellaceae bacterium]|jgi:flagellar protein FliS|nr:flagellar export chaperone FliS [Clostridia bacterium]
MNIARAYQAYQVNQVNTVSQEKLVTMLYDGALKFITQAINGIEERNLEKKNTNFIKAQKIIAELMGNLNRDVGEIADNLFLLYEFMYDKLVKANVKNDIEGAREVFDLLKDLRDTWVEASGKVQSHNYTTNQHILNFRAE